PELSRVMDAHLASFFYGLAGRHTAPPLKYLCTKKHALWALSMTDVTTVLAKKFPHNIDRFIPGQIHFLLSRP
ncbi:MAG: hypothetical protein J5838_05315, partial [Desulfovibrio sp.]|nr:hypothetical protein [Desulfovibrio sp.]